MKKFKKPLTINIMDQDSHENSSPNQEKYRQGKQTPLLMFNEHTVASSANNQDDQMQDRMRQQQSTCQEFNQFYSKNPFQNDKNQTVELNNKNSQSNKFQKYKKFNVVQFQQFSLETQNNKALNQQLQNNPNKIPFNNQKIEIKPNKKQFSIQIPQQQRTQKHQTSSKFGFDIKNEAIIKKNKNNSLKQPPAPSNKAKMSKSSNRHFIFPTNDQEDKFQETNKKHPNQIQIINQKNINQEQQKLKINQINKQWLQKIQDINKSFQKQRQEFYKEKSNLQRDLMIKDGQIQMLQKLITNRYSPKQGTIGTNPVNQHANHSQFSQTQRSQIYRSTFNQKFKQNIQFSQEKIKSLQTILLEKDLQINSLLQKINDLNKSIQRKNNQLQEFKINIIKSQNLNESLKNQIFLLEKKEQSQNLTRNFYRVKQTLNQAHQSGNSHATNHHNPHLTNTVNAHVANQASRTPKGYSMNKWQQDLQKSKQKSIQFDKKQYPLRGIDDLHKRLESLKMNRIQLQNRGKIKSEIGYSQTSKNKGKGTFDFKGKFYDRDRDYINHSRMY